MKNLLAIFITKMKASNQVQTMASAYIQTVKEVNGSASRYLTKISLLQPKTIKKEVKTVSVGTKLLR